MSKQHRLRKPSFEKIVLWIGICLTLAGIAYPFFYWYIIKKATCEPSNDLCGLENFYAVFAVTPILLIIGVSLIVIGISLNKKK